MLKQQQQIFANCIIGGQSANGYFSGKPFSATKLVQIYRNNYIFGLTDALKASYSCVFRLVGEEFFTALAKSYIEENQPTEGYLQDYGDTFAQFITRFKPCKTLPYLADVATFERYYERCYHQTNAKFLLYSDYPILDIWQLNEQSDTLNLTKTGQYALIAKVNLEVVVSQITQEKFLQLGGKNGQIN